MISMNATFNCITLERSEVEHDVLAAVYGCVLVLGLPLNALSLWVLIRRHGLKSSSAVFMSHLALSDLLLVLSLPTRVYFYATDTWPLGSQVCLIVTMLFRNNIRSSAIFITFISLDRLLAVVYPLRTRHLRNSANAWKACVFIWILIVAINVPESIDHQNDLREFKVTNSCFALPPCVGNKYAPYIQSGMIFVLLAVNVACTAVVSWTLYGHLSNTAMVKNKINVMLIFALNMLMFIIFFMPFSIVFVLNVDPTPVICLASINCCFDPLLYYFSFDAFWKKKEGSENKESLARSHELK